MKGKQLTLLLVLLAALGGIALLLYSRKVTSWSKTATATEGNVLSFSLNEVSHVTIKTSDAELNLEKRDNIWRVRERADYPANFNKVATLLRQLWELHPTQDVQVGPSQLGRLQLIEPGKESGSGTLVDLTGNGDQRLAALLLGKPQLREMEPILNNRKGIPIGRYIMRMDGSHRAFLVSETFDEIQTTPSEWLNQTFIAIENPETIEVIGTSPPMNWKLTRETNSAPWKFFEPKREEKIDAAKTSTLVALLTSLTFADVLDPKTSSAELGLDQPSIIRVKTFDNFIYELHIGKLKDNNYPVFITVSANLAKDRSSAKDEKPENKTTLEQQFAAKQARLAEKFANEKKFENWPYLISKVVIDRLLTPRSALLAEKNKSPSPTSSAPKSK